MLNILVTGAAGLIGGEVCARAVAAGHRVHALVHNSPEVRGNDGTTVTVAAILHGDVTQEGLGIATPPDEVDCVIHCAAALAFDAPRALLDPINLGGTGNAVAFAKTHGARLVHVSTAYVCGLAEGRIVEGPVPPETRFTNNYEASKAAAEALVETSGIDWCIARPSIVQGDHASGTIRDFPALCTIFRLMARGAMPVLPASENATLDLVPIDHVARGIVRLAELGALVEGRHFHLVSGQPLPARALAEAVNAVEHFPNPVSIDPADFDPAGLGPVQRRATMRMVDTYGSYLSRSPLFDDSSFRTLTGLSCPPTDHDWLGRLIAYGIERGYLPQRTSG